jgi:hypothetical protein
MIWTISASLASRRTSFSTRVISASTPRSVMVRSLSPLFIDALRSSCSLCFTSVSPCGPVRVGSGPHSTIGVTRLKACGLPEDPMRAHHRAFAIVCRAALDARPDTD